MNAYTIFDARLVSEPKTRTVGKGKDAKSLTTIRVADNQQGKKDDEAKKRNPARFVTVKGWDKQGELLGKLSKGDVITVSGELVIEAFQSKETNETVTDDVLKLGSFRVQKSESFYGREAEPAKDAPDTSDIPF